MDDQPITEQSSQLAPWQFVVAVLWSIAVALSGLSVGWLIAQTSLGVLGNIALLLIGLLAGVGARSVMGRPVAWVGWMLVVAMFVACYFSLVAWVKLEEHMKVDSWVSALGLPNVNFVTITPGLFCAAVGAYTAYQQAGARGRWRYVRDE